MTNAMSCKPDYVMFGVPVAQLFRLHACFGNGCFDFKLKVNAEAISY